MLNWIHPGLHKISSIVQVAFVVSLLILCLAEVDLHARCSCWTQEWLGVVIINLWVSCRMRFAFLSTRKLSTLHSQICNQIPLLNKDLLAWIIWIYNSLVVLKCDVWFHFELHSFNLNLNRKITSLYFRIIFVNIFCLVENQQRLYLLRKMQWTLWFSIIQNYLSNLD